MEKNYDKLNIESISTIFSIFNFSFLYIHAFLELLKVIILYNMEYIHLISIHTCPHAHMPTCIHECTTACIHACTNTCLYAYMHAWKLACSKHRNKPHKYKHMHMHVYVKHCTCLIYYTCTWNYRQGQASQF
jgi:hypothetical protein